MNYRGWAIAFSMRYQVYVACRFGVTMNHKDLSGLQRMIDLRIDADRVTRSMMGA